MINRNKQTRKPNRSFDDDDFVMDFGRQSIRQSFYCQNLELVFYIYGDIGEVDQYIDLIHALDTASEDQIIHLRIATCGGYVDSAVAILNSIARSKATIVTHADSNVQSAGTLIFLAGNQFKLYPHSNFMFHHCSSGAGNSKNNDHVKKFTFYEQMMDELYQTYIYPILTQEEIDRLKIGEEFWIGSNDMADRLIKSQPIIDEMLKEFEIEEEGNNVVEVEQQEEEPQKPTRTRKKK